MRGKKQKSLVVFYREGAKNGRFRATQLKASHIPGQKKYA
jgi:hypothetical protein